MSFYYTGERPQKPGMMLPMSYLINNYHRPAPRNYTRTKEHKSVKRAIMGLLGQDMFLENPGYIKS